MTDYRSFEVAGARVSLSRAVDLDLDALTDEDKAVLIGDAKDADFLPKELLLTTKSLRATRSMRPMPGEIRGILHEIKVAGGQAFDEGDDRTRRAAAFAWHMIVSEFDVWPMNSSLYGPWHGGALDLSVAEDKQPGEFVYDTWLNVFELERYFYNAWLRAYYWINAGFEIKRWSNNRGEYVTATDSMVMTGDEPMPFRFVEKLSEPTEWIRSDVKGGAASWKWPVEWLSFYVGEGDERRRVDVSDMDISRYCFSWHELLVRFEELTVIRERAARFAKTELTRDGRSCGGRLSFRADGFLHRFGPWYTYAKKMWMREGEAEKRFLL